MTKTKKLVKHLPLAIAGFAVSLGVLISFSGSKKQETVPTFATYSNGDGATYYNGISESLTGDDLLAALRGLNSERKKYGVDYDDMGTTPSGLFKYTDYDPSTVQYDSNHQPYGTKLISFYSGNSATSGMNREHVWPQSHGGKSVEDDIHMPRPTIIAENGSRGNSFYVEGKCHSSLGWDPAMESFGDQTYRGDSARIVFYCVVANSKFNLVDDEYHSTTNANPDNLMGKLTDLIKWNINYPVLEREQRRNEGAEYLQGNRNPFIDHPEYACKIWGTKNSTIQNLCSNATYPTDAHTAGIRVDDGNNVSESNSTTCSIQVDESISFVPFVDGEHNASVSWSLSDNTVASSVYYSRGLYTNGVTITGLKQGTTILTLTYSYDDNGVEKSAKAQVLITVSSSSSSGGGSGEVQNITSATYTVTSTSSVSKTGTAPDNSSATYSQSYSTAGQITKKNNATLTLSGYAGKVVTGITLNMRSNGSSGSGSFTATIGSSSIASTSGAFNTWYDNTSFGTNFRDVHVVIEDSTRVVEENEKIKLVIAASANSLYINSFTITYGTFESVIVYGYAEFAQDILDLTNSICSSTSSKETALSGVWSTLENDKYSILANEDQLVLVSYKANKDSSDVTAQAMARYDQICKKYASCTNFIGRSSATYSGAQYTLDENINNNSTSVVLIVAMLLSTSSLMVLLIIKKKNALGRR